MNRNTIAGFSGQPASGLATVHFTDGTSAHVESGFGLRQFAAAFGSLEEAVGQQIEWLESDLGFGLMESFEPVEADEADGGGERRKCGASLQVGSKALYRKRASWLSPAEEVR